MKESDTVNSGQQFSRPFMRASRLNRNAYDEMSRVTFLLISS